jgi:integrase
MERLRSLHRLKEAELEELPAGEHHDGGGLFLLVESGGARRWYQRLTINEKRVKRGLGPYPLVSLEAARDRAIDLRRGAREGKDVARQARAPTFRQAFEHHFAQRKKGLKNAKHIWQWQAGIERHAYPKIGDRPVSDVTHDEIVAVLSKIWRETPETARRILRRITIIFDLAISRGFRERANPCLGVAEDLGKQGDSVEHYLALPYKDVPAFIRQLRICNSWPITKLAFEWLILTASRPGEVRGATKAELRGDVWVIPKERMKAKAEHVVPLPPRCQEIAQEASAIAPGALLFPSRSGKPLSNMTFTKVLRDLDMADRARAHGFRSSFKDWSAEVAKARDEVSEAALAHRVPDKVKAAYLRTKFLEERRQLMDDWAAHCAGVANPSLSQTD